MAVGTAFDEDRRAAVAVPPVASGGSSDGAARRASSVSASFPVLPASVPFASGCFALNAATASFARTASGWKITASAIRARTSAASAFEPG